MKAESVLSSNWETFGEIYKATKIDRDDLARLIEQYRQDGQIEFGFIVCRDWRIPVMRLAAGLKPVWKRKKVKR